MTITKDNTNGDQQIKVDGKLQDDAPEFDGLEMESFRTSESVSLSGEDAL